MSPRVSVILPTHDRPALLQEALASLQAQTFGDWEAVVVDDASDPPVRNDWGDARVRVVRHEAARGGAAAKNSGIAQARGEVV
ncbi:MAG: glycosyltransferase family 2 protein, partial [Burkholderiales bacterium]|nr:glycosyltransferase family 2 protein [Burkholderiales bacterium]